MDNFKWTKFSDRKPEMNIDIYITDHHKVWISNSYDIETIGPVDASSYSWCYVYIPDVPKPKKIEPCKELKGLSNDYILGLENRIETLEKVIGKML
jgi:hypothetical protein